jgi:pyridoxamine 5'-phosphate oxidase
MPVQDPRAQPLSRRDLDPEPLRQLRRWYADAEAAGAPLPEAASLATATPEGRPSVRMVLVKALDERGLEFYTGYESRKGGELAANPRAALLFYWHELGRQVRIEGAVERVSAEESDEYFATRPPGAQFSAASSPQGEVVPGRAELERRAGKLRDRHPDGGVPRPRHWGGYRLLPDAYEFWQHREDRLHDRFRYRRDGERWIVERLAP